MNKIKSFFTNKRFIYGSGSVVLILGIIAVAVLMNVIVGTLSDKFTLKIDITENKIFDLSQQTIDTVKSISEPIDIILIETSGSDVAKTRELIQRYVNLNGNLKLRTADPVKNPASIQKYSNTGTNISVGSVIFDNGKKFKIVPSSDLIASYSQQNDYFQAESKLTSAIISLSKSGNITVALSDGHGEASISAAEQIMKDDGITVEKVNTLTEGFADKYDLFLVVSPKTDFTSDEIEKLDTYLKSGKNAQFYFDLQNPQLPKLEEYLSDNGITLKRNVIFESDSKKIIYNTPYVFLTTVKDHPITKAIVSSGTSVIAYANMPVVPLWDEKNSVKLETLLETSNKAFTVLNDGAKTDETGPFGVAVVATKSYENSKKSKVMVTGSSVFLQTGELLSYNKDFLLSSLNWQVNDTEAVNISPKRLTGSKLELNQQDLIIWGIVFVIFIPIIVLVIGLATWLRRRHL